MRTSFRNTAIVATALFGLGTFAVNAAPAAAGDPTATHPTSQSKAQPAAAHNMEGSVESHITDLHAKLHITVAQQPQWDAFVQVMRDNARDMDQTFQQRTQTLQAMTASENMQSYARVAQEHSDDMQKLVPVFKSLYDTMSTSQQKIADQVFRDDAHKGSPAKHS